MVSCSSAAPSCRRMAATTTRPARRRGRRSSATSWISLPTAWCFGRRRNINGWRKRACRATITEQEITGVDPTDQQNALFCCARRLHAERSIREGFMARPSVADKRRTFKELHRSGCFIIPNPWNVGTARRLQGLGFKALATTSSGFAHAEGFADGLVPLEMVLDHLRELAAATDVPLNADFEGGYADDPDGVAKNVRLAAATGVAGLSIEDSTSDDKNPLYDFDLAVARVRAARKAIDAAGGDVVFTGRSEGFICGRPDLDETLRRLKAYAEAGADCLYAPGIKTREQIVAVVQAVAPKPVNFLMSSAMTNFSLSDLEALGVRRISTGGTLARVVWTAFMHSAREMAEQGRFDSFNGTIS